MNLSATPGRPACPSRASGWSSLTPPWGLPCCVRFPCVHAVATTPAQRLGVLLRSFSPAVSAFPERVAGSACASSFSRFARRSLALRPAHSRRHQFVTRYPEGFSHFVTSMTAPVASGWSVRRVGLAPTGKRRLSTAHTRRQSLRVKRRLRADRSCRVATNVLAALTGSASGGLSIALNALGQRVYGACSRERHRQRASLTLF